MRRKNWRLLKAIVHSYSDDSRCASQRSQDIYTILPEDLEDAEADVRRLEQDWWQAGALTIAESQVEQALLYAEGLQSELNQARAQSRPGFRLQYLRLVRLFVLTRLPGYGKTVVIGAITAVICGISLLLTPFFFSSAGTAFFGAFIMLVIGTCLTSAIVLVLWPTEEKRQSFHRLEEQVKAGKQRLEALRPSVEQAWANYATLRDSWKLCVRLDEARQRRDELATLLASEKYKLLHTDWRSLRGIPFEEFLCRVFQLLGYDVELTKASGDQGVDLVVAGKGRRIAVQAKGYADSVGNEAVQNVVAGSKMYRCDSCAAITNSRFTQAAKELAHVNCCDLIDSSQMIDLIEGRIY